MVLDDKGPYPDPHEMEDTDPTPAVIGVTELQEILYIVIIYTRSIIAHSQHIYTLITNYICPPWLNKEGLGPSVVQREWSALQKGYRHH